MCVEIQSVFTDVFRFHKNPRTNIKSLMNLDSVAQGAIVMTTCPHCGRSINGNAVVCTHCGRSLSVDCWNWRLSELRVAEEKKRIDQLNFLREAFRANRQDHAPRKSWLSIQALNERGATTVGEETKQHTSVQDISTEGNVCPNCSQPIPDDSVFCVRCGQSVDSDHAEKVERMVFDYISSRNGEVSMSQMCKDLQLSEQDLLGAIERLKEKKMFAI